MTNSMNGHYPLAPSNQYCAFCNTAMFVSILPCPNPKQKGFTNEDWATEMQLAKELSEG